MRGFTGSHIHVIRRAVCVALLFALLSGVVSVSPARMSAATDPVTEARTFLAEMQECFKHAVNTSDFRDKFNDLEEKYIHYLNAQEAGSTADDHEVIKELLKLEADGSNSYYNCMGQFNTLLKYAYLATEKIKEAAAKSVTDEGSFNEFEKMIVGPDFPKNDKERGIKNAHGSGSIDQYYKKFNQLSGNTLMQDCLVSRGDVTQNKNFMEYLLNNRNYVVKEVDDTYISDTIQYPAGKKYEKKLILDTNSSATMYLDTFDALNNKCVIESAYLTLRSDVDVVIKSSGMTSTVMGKIKDFDDIKNAHNGAAVVRLLYNHVEIDEFMQRYYRIKTFLDKLATITSVPKTQSEIKLAREVYDLYDALPADDKSLICAEDKTKLDEYCGVEAQIGIVKNKIADITWPTDDASYDRFCDDYNDAQIEYNTLITKYQGTGVDELISNRALLDDYLALKNFIDRIKRVQTTQDIDMCSIYKSSIEPIYNDYYNSGKLNDNVKNHVYNWNAFLVLYDDVKEAYTLRARIDKLTGASVVENEAEILAISQEYDQQNAKVRDYFGETYKGTLNTLIINLGEQNRIHAERVIELIDKLGLITEESGRFIVEAETAYAALSPNEKNMITNYENLKAARERYDLLRADISLALISNVKVSYVYKRTVIKPTPVVRIDGTTLIRGTDYTVSYANNKDVGTAQITIRAVDGGKYIGTVYKTFKINKKSISGGTVSNVKSKYKYTGKSIKPTPKLKVGGYTLKKGTDYTVSYSKNKKKGTATITLKGKGNYKGTKKKTFKIY